MCAGGSGWEKIMRWRCATWTTRSSSLGDHLHCPTTITGSAQAAAAGWADMAPAIPHDMKIRQPDSSSRLPTINKLPKHLEASGVLLSRKIPSRYSLTSRLSPGEEKLPDGIC
jgi:phage tail protein X